jgi:hypothetical protein
MRWRTGLLVPIGLIATLSVGQSLESSRAPSAIIRAPTEVIGPPIAPAPVSATQAAVVPVEKDDPPVKAGVERQRTVKFTTANQLNVRADASTSAKVLLQLPHGTPVDVMLDREGWSRISLARGGIGWVSNKYLANNPPEKRRTSTRPRQQSGSQRRTLVEAILSDSQRPFARSCPCPDSRDSSGRRCGEKSVYTRTHGTQPLCYASDITAGILRPLLQRR